MLFRDIFEIIKEGMLRRFLSLLPFFFSWGEKQRKQFLVCFVFLEVLGFFFPSDLVLIRIEDIEDFLLYTYIYVLPTMPSKAPHTKAPPGHGEGPVAICFGHSARLECSFCFHWWLVAL